MSDLIFVYGTLRRGFPATEPERRQAFERFLGTGSIRALLYDLGPYPGAVASASPEERVRGEVYALRKNALAVLDRYEVAVTGSELGGTFARALAEVQLDAGEKRRAWVYFYNRAPDGARRIAGGDYLAHLAAGEP